MKPEIPRDPLWEAPTVGFNSPRRTVCIGLDLAWFGGSANNRASQFDFLAAAILDENGTFQETRLNRIPLLNRDPLGEITVKAISDLLDEAGACNSRVVLAIDAPLQSKGTTETKQFRSSERYFSKHRQGIDKLAGAAMAGTLICNLGRC